MTRNPIPLHLQGKKGLIVGLANEHSIAWGCTQATHHLGAQLVTSCLNDKARQWVAPLTDGIGVSLHTCNAADPAELKSLVDAAVDEMGDLDFIIHSIAWAPMHDLHSDVTQTSRQGFNQAMEISCHSFAELAALCAPHMPRGGSMLTMTYLGAEEAVPHYGLMGPVKAALESMVRYMALELGERNLRVHAVSPGPIHTRAASGIDHFDELAHHAKEKSALRRLVTLEEIGGLCAFLCSDAASGMTGQTIYVDAGCHAMA